MDEEIERLVVSVRADTAGFAKDVGDMNAQLEGPFTTGLERAGNLLENTLSRAIKRGTLDLEDLKQVALSVIGEIASAAINSGIGNILGGANSGGLLGIGASLLSALSGAPGRATGGPVTAGRAYRVGEQGPEYFVPSASGRIATADSYASPSNLQLTFNISDNGKNSAPDQIRRSSRQVARAVRSALAYREG